MGWTFSAERFQPQTITELADAYLGELQSLIEHCLRDDAGGLTPSDFPLERIKQRLRAELPKYMVPLHWLWLDKLSLNANGKLDRKALPALEIGQIQSLDSLAPRNELEQTLADIWAEVLKVDKVGVRDNFFELGGHSLLATQIASRVQKALQRDVPLRAMFECSTVVEWPGTSTARRRAR